MAKCLKQQPEESTGKSEVHDYESLIVEIFDAIDRYDVNSLDFKVFEPLYQDHLLCTLVGRLSEELPFLFKPGSTGKRLWRRVVRSSFVPPADDYLRIFEDLDAFEARLASEFRLCVAAKSGIANGIPHDQSSSRSPAELNDSQLEVLNAVIDQPRRGKEIAKTASRSHDSVRHILPRLIKLGLVQKTSRGYARLCSQDGHNANTS